MMENASDCEKTAWLILQTGFAYENADLSIESVCRPQPNSVQLWRCREEAKPSHKLQSLNPPIRRELERRSQ